MQILPETQEAINLAHESMLKNPAQAVFYFYRIKIYETFKLYKNQQDNQIFKRLALITSQYVLPIWQRAQPKDNKAKHLLYLANEFLDNRLPIDVIQSEADLYWDYSEKFDGTDESFSIGNAIYAQISIAEAAMEICKKIPYKGMELNEEEDDFYVDIWVGDTAFWAASAYAGRFGAPDLDPEKNKIFWTWWLEEAISKAILGELK